jgi:hypothetical protein
MTINLPWKPTKPQRKFKARAYRMFPKDNFARLTPKEIKTMTKSQTVEAWLELPEFREWFFDKDTTRLMLEVGSELAVQRLIDIVECTDVGPGGEVTSAAQVNAAKIILEMADYAPVKKRQEIKLDKQLEGKSTDELKEYVRQNMELVNDKAK